MIFHNVTHSRISFLLSSYLIYPTCLLLSEDFLPLCLHDPPSFLYMQEKENVKPLKELTHLLTGSIVLAFTLFRFCHFPPTPSQKMHNMPEKFENAALCNFPARIPEFYADTNSKWSVIVAFSNFSDVEDRAETRLRMSLIRAGKPGNI